MGLPIRHYKIFTICRENEQKRFEHHQITTTHRHQTVGTVGDDKSSRTHEQNGFLIVFDFATWVDGLSTPTGNNRNIK